MDSPADDAIEELIVGNRAPEWTSLATLFLDLQNTEVFMTFREAKCLLAKGRAKSALPLFVRILGHSPENIVYRYFAARAYSLSGDFDSARKQLHAAITIGERRDPPQRLSKIHKELEKLNKEHFSWTEKILSLLHADKSSEPFARSSEDMIDETNKAIARISAERKKKAERKKQLGA